MPSRQHRLRKNTTLPRAYRELLTLAPDLQDRLYEHFDPLGHLDGATPWLASLLREADYRVLGVGGARVVVDVGGGFAAKVAADAYGIQQNRAEAAFWEASPLPDLMPIHHISEDGIVLLTEKAETPVSEAEAQAAAARLAKHPRGKHIGDTEYTFQWGRHEGKIKLLDYGDSLPRSNPAPRLRRNNVTAAPQTETAAFKKWFGKSKVVDADGKPLVVYHGTMGGGFVEFDLGKIDKHHSGFFFTNSKVVAESYGMGNPLPRRVCAVPDIRTVADVRRFVKSPENAFENGWRIVLNESRQVIEEDESDDLPYTGMGARVFTSFSPFWERNGLTEDIGESYYYPPYTDLVSDIRQALRRGGPLTSGTYAVYLRMLKPMVVDGKGAAWMSISYKGGYYKTNQLSAIAKEKGHDGLILRNIYDSSIVQDVISDVYVVFDPHNIKSATANVGTFDRKDADIRKNPLRFEAHYTTKAAARYRDSRAVRSILSAALQKRSVLRMANTPHNFVVVVQGEQGEMPVFEDAVTLGVSLESVSIVESEVFRPQGTGERATRESLYTAFTLLHRLGDVILLRLWGDASPDSGSLSLWLKKARRSQDPAFVDFYDMLDDHLALLIAPVAPSLRGALSAYTLLLRKSVNSKMVREGYSSDWSQAFADLFPLCELTPASRPLLLPVANVPGMFDEILAAFNEQVVPDFNVRFRAFYNRLIPSLYGKAEVI